MSCGGRNELGKKSKVENCNLWIGQIGKRTVQKQFPQWTNAFGADRQDTALGTQQADAKINQVRSANQLEQKKQPFGCAQNCTESERGQNGMPDEAHAHAG